MLFRSIYGIDADYARQATACLDHVQASFPLRIDHRARKEIPNGSPTLGAIPQCMESFLHVVTETCFWEDKEHLTEKIFKPIVARQPFVLLGCAGNLQYLKDYGFRTFDRWWDESYDSIADPVQRLEAVVKIVRDICQRSTHELEAMLADMSAVLEYNLSRFYSQNLLDQVWLELAANLSRAIKEPPPAISQTQSLDDHLDMFQSRRGEYWVKNSADNADKISDCPERLDDDRQID